MSDGPDRVRDALRKYKVTIGADLFDSATFVREESDVDSSFLEWLQGFPKPDPEDMPLCAGARVVIDENGEGTLTIDENLPDGEWVVKYPTKTYRLYGVKGPTRARTEAEHDEDIEVSPVALTFETRK